MARERYSVIKSQLSQPEQVHTVARRGKDGGYDVVTVQHFDSSPRRDYTLLQSLTKTANVDKLGCVAGIGSMTGVLVGLLFIINSIASKNFFQMQTYLAIFLTGLSLVAAESTTVMKPSLDQLERNRLDGLERLFAREEERKDQPTSEAPTIPDVQAVKALLQTRDSDKPPSWPTP